MQILKERFEHSARHLGNGVLKVDSFINHQIDPILMQGIGEEFGRLFAHTKPTKILTAEVSGIAPAVAAGIALKIPVIFARKSQPITMRENPFRVDSFSPTHKKAIELVVSREYLLPADRVLIIDDFLATGSTSMALALLTKQSGALLVGIGAVIEKAYSGGRNELLDFKVPIEALCSIKSVDGEKMVLG